MADNDTSLTPEKRLLQLIEGGRGEQAAATQTVRKNSFFSKFQQVLSPQGLKNLVQETKEACVDAFKNRKDFINLRGANKAGKIMTVVLGVFLLINMFYEIQVVNSNYVSGLQIPKKETSDIKFSEKKIFDTNLLNEAEKLNVFIPYDKRQKPETKEEESAMSLKLVGIIKDWKLAGISYYASNPEKTFCMVEDLQKNTTTFLKVGDTLSGLVVAKINPDSVLFQFNEETIELR